MCDYYYKRNEEKNKNEIPEPLYNHSISIWFLPLLRYSLLSTVQNTHEKKHIDYFCLFVRKDLLNRLTFYVASANTQYNHIF